MDGRVDHKWIVERHEAFAFRGPSGNPAIADLAIVTRDDSVPVVVATERDDNPGISVTNGAEQLAAHVLMRFFPERMSQEQPFRLVEHYRANSFDATDLKEVQFTDFRLQTDRVVPRIGDVVEWRPLDARVAKVLAEQTKAAEITPQIEQPERAKGDIARTFVDVREGRAYDYRGGDSASLDSQSYDEYLERVIENVEVRATFLGVELNRPYNYELTVHKAGESHLIDRYRNESEVLAAHRGTVEQLRSGKVSRDVGMTNDQAQQVTPDVRYGKSGRPYIADLVGVYHTEEPRIEQRVVLDEETGERRTHSYGIAAGDYNIIGAMSPERDRVMDAAVAFRGIDLDTHQASYLTTQMNPEDFLELSKTNRITLEPGILELVKGQDQRIEQAQAQEHTPALSLQL